jgi:hypothetical protein
MKARRAKSSVAEKLLVRTVDGQLDLSNCGLTDLSMIGDLPDLKYLDVSNNHMKSFQSLRPQQNLKSIVAVNNPIEFLDGLRRQPALRHLDLRETPLAKEESFKYKTIATVGLGLVMLNGERLTREDQDIATVWGKVRQQQLFLAKEEMKSTEQKVSESIWQIYVRENEDLFGKFALNEAIVFDLEKNGPLPLVDQSSTEDEMARAVGTLSKRMANLAEQIAEIEAKH